MRSFAFPYEVCWRDVEARVMTLLSADYLTRQRLHGLGDDMARADLWPASGFKYTDAFPRMCTVPNY